MKIKNKIFVIICTMIAMVSSIFLADIPSMEVYAASNLQVSQGDENNYTSENVEFKSNLKPDLIQNNNISSQKYKLSDFVNGQILVLYKNGEIEERTYIGESNLREGIEELKKDDTVIRYQPNFVYNNLSEEKQSVSQINDNPVNSVIKKDPYYSQQWWLRNNGNFIDGFSRQKGIKGIDINVEKAWETYKPKRSVVIALIDTGVDINDPELKNAIWSNPAEIPGNGIDDDKNGYIDDIHGWNFIGKNNHLYSEKEDIHGTHCAGIISAASNGKGIIGIAPYDNIKLMPLKVLGGTKGSGNTLSVIRAIHYAEINGAKICNLSMSADVSDPLLYMTMHNSSMLFTVAAGNDKRGYRNTDIYPSYPASYDLNNIISVANIDASGSLTYGSDYGLNTVDLAAPGSFILSTAGNGKYIYMTGTSMAAPMVAASAALVYTSKTDLTLDDTKNIIMSTTKSLPSLTGKCMTGGMLDIGKAVNYFNPAIVNNINLYSKDNKDKKTQSEIISFELNNKNQILQNDKYEYILKYTKKYISKDPEPLIRLFLKEFGF